MGMLILFFYFFIYDGTRFTNTDNNPMLGPPTESLVELGAKDAYLFLSFSFPLWLPSPPPLFFCL